MNKLLDTTWTVNNIPDLSGKTVVITGGNSGLGFASAKALSEKNAQVIIACRNEGKGNEAKQIILRANPNSLVHVMPLDLADLKSVKRFAKQYQVTFDKLDVLINNAGIMTVPFAWTRDGFESQIGTNHFGHFALTGLLMETIKKTPGARVVNVSSMAHKMGKIHFDNLNFHGGRAYGRMQAYAQSKLANLLFTYELQRWFEKNDINALSVAAHPGVSATNLAQGSSDNFLFRLFIPGFNLIGQSSDMGALPQLRAAVDPQVKGGTFYGPCSQFEFRGYPVIVQSNHASHNQQDAMKLWELSEKLTGVYYE
jgi:NAD(P)-dependent dehydrogenase (short-subunit alcohol dehydrogenase family)